MRLFAKGARYELLHGPSRVPGGHPRNARQQGPHADLDQNRHGNTDRSAPLDGLLPSIAPRVSFEPVRERLELLLDPGCDSDSEQLRLLGTRNGCIPVDLKSPGTLDLYDELALLSDELAPGSREITQCLADLPFVVR